MRQPCCQMLGRLARIERQVRKNIHSGNVDFGKQILFAAVVNKAEVHLKPEIQIEKNKKDEATDWPARILTR